MRKLVIAASLAAAALMACSTVENPVSGKAERTVMDERSEIEQGRQQHQQVLAEYGELKDARLQAYVNEIGQSLARRSDRPQLEWHFTVLDSPEVNAFALPGGYVYVTRGIMAYMDSEADLAGVMGHEIGHVAARHSAQRATREQTAGLGVLAASVLGALLESRGVSGAGDLAQQVSQGVAAGYIARYSRDQESEADRLGAAYLARGNYNPANMVDVIHVLQDQERFAADQARAEGRAPQEGPHWLDSHPSNEQRLRDIQQVAAQYKGTQSSKSWGDDRRSRYLQAIDGIVFGESREQGVTRGRNFYHEVLGVAVTAPAGWKIDNASDTLAFINPEKTAALLVQTVPTQAGSTHEQILREAVHAESGSTERLNLNGLPATHFSGTRRTSQGQSQPVELTVVTGPGSRNYLLIYAARDAASLERSRSGLRATEASFRPMSASDRLAARPWTLRTVPYPRGGFAELARRSPLPADAVQQLRLLNGMYGGGEPVPGQLVKTVE